MSVNIVNLKTDAFREVISENVPYDYGDFMRAANVAFNQMAANLHLLEDRFLNERLEKMQMYLQFQPNWDVESTQNRLMQDLDYINNLLEGHQQDWESASSDFYFSETSPRLQPGTPAKA